jgi:hypothetical protein
VDKIAIPGDQDTDPNVGVAVGKVNAIGRQFNVNIVFASCRGMGHVNGLNANFIQHQGVLLKAMLTLIGVSFGQYQPPVALGYLSQGRDIGFAANGAMHIFPINEHGHIATAGLAIWVSH